ncbi:uncharacterized protein LOC110847094 isoform X2 [Folsomia candida]|nr:uncharacterized protein LOC110847094 isoform X2 [Folsomia candida]
MSTEKPPSDDSVLDDALIDEDSMLDDDDESDDLADLTTNSIDITSPTSKIPPASISKVVAGSPTKLPISPVKTVEAVKRPAPSSPSKTQANGDSEVRSPAAKKKITINRESVQALPVTDSTPSEASDGDKDEKKIVKVGAVSLTAEEKARLRAQKFGATGGVSSTPSAAVAKSTEGKPAPIVDEKLKKRAERFNNGTSAVTSSESKVVSLTTEDDVKLAKRKERFGLVDESEKKETRAARFGAAAAAVPPSTTATTATNSSDKKTLRAARFAT